MQNPNNEIKVGVLVYVMVACRDYRIVEVFDITPSARPRKPVFVGVTFPVSY